MSRLRPFLAVLLALLLLGAQQAAVAHLVGHVAGSAAAVHALADSAPEGDSHHGAGLTQLCATCLAFAALDGAAAAPAPLLDLAEGRAVRPAPFAALPPTHRPRRAHPARAPPAVP
ncbi:MAG: DUF2946 family protein [Rhodocyclaceae bacterium]|nr:DUF2946 family protein [Rhodocyclaceae bacterium]